MSDITVHFQRLDRLPAEFLTAMKRHGVSPSRSRGAEQFGAYLDGELVGVYSNVFQADRSMHCKGDFVLPEHRGKGIYSLVMDRRLNEARMRGCRIAWAVVTPASFPAWRHRRARIDEEYGNGNKKVVIIL